MISGGKLSIETSHGPAKVDIMDLADDPAPPDEERRMFALARVDDEVAATAALGDAIADQVAR